MVVLQLVLQLASAIFAALAAWRWLKGSVVETPTRFPIHVVRPLHGGPLGGNPLDGEYMGHGYSEALNELGRQLHLQSSLNAQGARCAGVSVLLQAVSIALTAWCSRP